jgi:3-oxoisoapionate kinase
MARDDKASSGEPPALVWLGDDFTGAAAVMEVLTFSGVPSILFLGQPTSDQLAQVPEIKAFGIATLARSRAPEWMAENLPSLFAFLDDTNAELIHYKVCSTLDSSPVSGSIGKAIDLAMARFGAATIPIVTAAPRMRRYQAFGNLFCSAGDGVYRLDRHPVMSRHPITPMHEGDVALHLSAQTTIPTRCLNLETLSDPQLAHAFLDDASTANICSIDMMNADHETAVGALLWNRRRQSRFVVGSQGVEYALVSHFQKTGALKPVKPAQNLGPASRMAVVSGSVSPTTAAQIKWARDHGFAAIRVNVVDLCIDEPSQKAAEHAAIVSAKRALSQGQTPLVFTAEGPDDPAVLQLRNAVTDLDAANDMIGLSLGRILARLIDECGLSRVAVSGGDTSGHVCSQLGIYALAAAAPTIPGAAICKAMSDTGLDGLEIALKGGQMGSPDYFNWVRDGGGERSL